MTEEIKTQNEEKNTVATVGMWFSIIGLILTITLFFIWVGMPLLFLGFILGIIGLFNKPRKKARVAVSIPLVIFIALASVACYFWSSVKTPAKEWYDRVKPNMEQLYNEEDFDNDKFSVILQGELNDISSSLSEEDFKAGFETSTGSNTIEQRAYFGFGLFQQAIENAIEKYNNELSEVDEDENVMDDENEEKEEDSGEENEVTEQEEVTVETNEKGSSETFSQSEKNDIEQIIDILE